MSINVDEHGIALDERKRKVQCNYCGKVVSGFYRLKCHLGSLRGDVVPCEQVPSNIKEPLRTKLLETRRKNLVKQVGHLFHPHLPLKRNWSPAMQNHMITFEPKPDCHVRTVSETRKQVEQREQNSLPNRVLLPRVNEIKCNRLFFETGNNVDFTASVNTSNAKQAGWMELNGSVLREEVEQMGKYVKKVRDSWANTGCSILLDEWIDDKGRDLVNFLVDCPLGTIYIRSSDLSAFVGDIDALQMLLEEVIEEIGARNVVQIIAPSTTSRMWPATGQVVKRHRNMYNGLGTCQCIGLILEKIGKMHPFREILSKAKTLAKFIHGDASLLKLFRFYSHGHDLIKPNQIKSVMVFLTLENIVSQKQNLKDMFASSTWIKSIWAPTTQGKRMVNLLRDVSFWREAKILLEVTTPLVRVVCPLSGKALLIVGYIYKSFRQAKEEIKIKLGNKASGYMPFWNIIDEIWDMYLHTPLHSAGYYLNPGIFYTKNFYGDCEIERGLECCITGMIEDPHNQALIFQQLQDYEQAKGAFKDGSTMQGLKNISPVEWWLRYGEECPELQKFAIRILSQTCDGASRYGLRRSLAEKLLRHGRNSIEQQRFRDITFVRYNLQLQDSKLGACSNSSDA